MYFSQCGEDEFLNINYFKNKKNGIYIELGALDGNLYSNTKFFENNLNWTGILIEPHPIKFNDLVKNRPNNYLFNSLISNTESELEFRYFIDEYSGVSGVSNTLPKEHLNGFYKLNYPQSTILLKPDTLTSIVKQTPFKYIDFLSLDVEGHEYEVLLSWDFSIPINIILIETLEGSQEEKNELCRKLLIEKGYKLDNKYKHNEIYILNN